MGFEVKRVYDPLGPDDGHRFLVERLWPRGIKKEALQMEAWLKDIAPSGALRRWFGHDPGKWDEFRRRYAAELDTKPEAWRLVLAMVRRDRVTLLYSARDTKHNSAIALRNYLRHKLQKGERH
ncbi:MAG: DUF488 family protein [Deltaproteobacteria bacterium]|nr:DUF488 family protein [Deltaproteobacteria bacterium]